MANNNPGPADTITPNYVQQIGTGVGNPNIVTPWSLDAPGIQNAINTAAAQGGGTVFVPVNLSSQNIWQPINLSQLLVPSNCVKIKGVPPQLVYTTIPDSGLTTLAGSTGGTVLAPNGAFPSISWNTAVLPAPVSQTAFSQGGLTNISIEDIGFLGGTYGIYAGNTNNPSAWYSQFRNLYFTGQTVVGINVTNYQHCQFDGNYTFGCAWGQLHQIDVSSASLAPGNSTYKDLYTCNITGSGTAATISRNISFITTATTGGAADNNQFKFDRIQSNRFGGQSNTQAATMTNTQATFPVTDGTKYPVGMPVTFSATANGFTVAKVYFVVTNAGNTRSCSATYGGAAIVASGSTAVNIISTGFPCFEMIALSGSAQTNIVIDNLDVEGLSSCAAFFQNCNGVNVQVSQVPGTGQAPISIGYRGCANKFLLAPQSVSVDDDQNASGPTFFVGAKFGTSVGYQGIGFCYDSVSGKTIMSLGSQFDSPSTGTLIRDPATSGGIVLERGDGIGQNTKVVTSATFTVLNLNLAYINTSGGPGVINTLPTAAAANAGSWLEFENLSANSQQFNTDGVQLFNNIAARTSCTVNAGAFVRFRSTQTNTSAWTWCVVGGSSAMVAGVISAPT